MSAKFVKTLSAFFYKERQIVFYVFFTLLTSLILLSSLLQGCSGNGFYLRRSVDLPLQFQTVSLENLPVDSEFKDEFEQILEDAGGKLIEDEDGIDAAITTAQSIIRFEGFKEGRRVIAYTSERKAREYLLYLKFNYEVIASNVNKNDKSATANGALKTTKNLPKRRINIDKSYLYDPDFALGKAEEEKLVKKNLYQEAARLILLRLQYSK